MNNKLQIFYNLQQTDIISKLPIEFYSRHVVDVAKDLLGKSLAYGDLHGIITETEAYRGYDDEASHAFRGITKRSEIMFGAPGHAYVYMIYGMYYCLNIVAEIEGQAAAVLIRGIKLQDIHLDGPGKACRHLRISKEHNGINLVKSDYLYVTEGIENPNFKVTTRIGIKKAKEKLWRFVMM